MNRRHVLLGLSLASGLLVPASGALGLTSFATPSRNIGCIGDKTEVRCDIAETSAKPPPRPPSCDYDWGAAYAVGPKGRGRGVCASDTALPSPGQPGVRILKYGTSIRFGRITCTSRKTGMTCRNTSAHGFTLSREQIRLF